LHKLDFRNFTALCPRMVQRRARRAFDLFLYLAGRFLYTGGQAISDSHEQLCQACRLDPLDPASRPAMSRLLRMLRGIGNRGALRGGGHSDADNRNAWFENDVRRVG
jgi:hypothetical protein